MNDEQFTAFYQELSDRAAKLQQEGNDLRWGQSLMNALFEFRRPLYNVVRGTDADCFYNDEKLHAFKAALRSHFVTKRDNWTNEEVMDILRGCKLANRDEGDDDPGGQKFIDQHNDAIDDAIGTFYDFTRPLTEMGAMARTLAGDVVHVGALYPCYPTNEQV